MVASSSFSITRSALPPLWLQPLLMIVLVLLFATVPEEVTAQFGVGGGGDVGGERRHAIPDEILADGLQQRRSSSNTITPDQAPYNDGVGSLHHLTAENAEDIEALVKEGREDPETVAMIAQLKEDMADEIADLQKWSSEDVLGGMMEAMRNLQMLDVLFRDKDRALAEMEKEGMIKDTHREAYQKDPDLLEKDTRRALRFQFYSLAVVAGFL